ncbi:MAG: tetraacyldisaccharide 4'-kinase [Psychroflexus sp.]|nr:tetraacyldisaccharide 4'-kinase [Psychroflexus sp.]
MTQLRKILLPFAFIYGWILRMRNWLYNQSILKSHQFKTPSICIGNLNTGGSGKTPFLALLANHFQKKSQIAILSRGYKRATKGFRQVNLSDKAKEVGDEPLQFKHQFPYAYVAVDEKRAHGMQQLEADLKPDMILLDDAFQHRAVKADLSILLTTYQNPFSVDLLLPAGNLREPVSGAKRADIIVVTKTPQSISSAEKNRLKNKLRAHEKQTVFFSHIVYSDQIISHQKTIPLADFNHFTLVTGIANPKPLCDYLDKLQKDYKHLRFSDHHAFTQSELEKIKNQQPVLTTQKDFMRLKQVSDLKELYYLPIAFDIDDKEHFFQLLDYQLYIKTNASSTSNQSVD